MRTLDSIVVGAGPQPDGFAPAAELVQYFQSYVERFALPVRTGVTVVSIEQPSGAEHFVVRTNAAFLSRRPPGWDATGTPSASNLWRARAL